MIDEERAEQAERHDAVYVAEDIAEALYVGEGPLQAAPNAGWEVDRVAVYDDGGGFIDASHSFAEEPEAQGIEIRLDPGNSGDVYYYHARLGSHRRWLVVEGHGPMPTPEEAREAYLEAYAEEYGK